MLFFANFWQISVYSCVFKNKSIFCSKYAFSKKSLFSPSRVISKQHFDYLCINFCSDEHDVLHVIRGSLQYKNKKSKFYISKIITQNNTIFKIT